MALEIDVKNGEQLVEIISALEAVGVSVEEVNNLQVDAGEYSPTQPSAVSTTFCAELTVSWEGNEY